MVLNGQSIALFLSLVAIAFAGPSAAADLCVDQEGDCPFSKIQDAIDAATAGDTIEIEEGTYEEVIVVDERLTLEGESGVVIQPPTSPQPDPADPVLRVTAAGVKLRSFEVRGGKQPIGILIEEDADDTTIDDLAVADVESGNCIKTNADRTTVKHTKVEACGSACIQAGDPGNPQGPENPERFSDYFVVEDTTVKACLGEGILVHGAGARVGTSKIARSGASCVAVFGDFAAIYDSEATNCYLCGYCVLGNSALVDRSVARVTLEDGICGIGANAKLTRNRARHTLLSGIFWEGDAYIEKNEIDDAGFHGMDLWGQDFRVRYNEVEDSGGDAATDCYRIGANNSWIRSNEAEGCPDDGFGIEGSDNYIENNDTESIVDNGFEIPATANGNPVSGNRLRVNEANDSGSFDLCDEGNSQDLGNDFDTSAFAGCAD